MATRRLVVEVVGDASSLSRTFRGASADSAKLGGSLGRLSIGLGQLVKGIVVVDAVQGAFRGLSDAAHLGIEGFTDTTRVAAQTAAVIKSTGDASNLTAKQMHALAASLSNLSGIDDEVIQTGENALASFTNIRDFAGKGNQIFTDATKAITDYASRTGKDLPQAAIVFGRALSDPANKLAGLSRAGIVFTKSQIAAIKAMVKTGDVLGAQRKIIADLESRYAGAAKAAGKTLPGQLNVLRERFKDLAGEIVGNVTPGLKGFVTAVTATVVKITEASGFRAKLSVLWTGVQEAAAGAEAALRRAIGKVDWTKVWAGANGIAEGLQKRLDAIDWGNVGKAIGDGIAKGVAGATGFVKPLAEKLDKAFQTAFKSIDFNKFGRAAGPGLAAAMVSAVATLLDPSFWIKNWDLALAIAATAFSDGLGRIAGKFAAPFLRLTAKIVPALADFGTEMALRLIDSLERVAPRLGTAADVIVKRIADGLAKGLSSLVGVADRALARLIGPFVRFYQRASALTRFTIKVLGAQAVIDEIANIVGKIGGVFGGLAATIGHALDGAWKGLERSAIKAALAIVEPFTHIPTQLVGHKFQDIKDSLDVQLNGMVADAQKAGAAIQAAVAPPAGPIGPIGPVSGTPSSPIGSRNASAGFGGDGLPPPPILKGAPGLSASQRNTFFDNAISSDLTRAGFITNIKSQIGALQTIAGLISARLAATKDVTRRRTLEDQLLSVQSQIKGDQAQVASAFLASLQFGITKDQATATFKDDIAGFTALENGIKAQIKATGDTLDLEQQLFDAVQGLKAAKSSQLSAKDFKILGFGPTGDDITPGLKRLRTEYAKVISEVGGTSLDTSKVRAQLAGIKSVISDALVPPDVRSKMQQLLADLQKQLDGATGNLSKFQHTSTSKILAGLGLSPDLEKALRSRLAQVGAGGTVPAGHTKAFAGGGGSSSGDTTIVLNNPVFHGVTDAKKLESDLIKLKRHRAPRRTGPN